MLKIFRKKIIAKIVFWALIILILPGFVLYGVYSRDTTKGAKYAGMIDNKKVSFSDLAESFSSVKTQILLNYFNQPQIMDNLLKNRSLLAKVAWDRLIMLKEAKKWRIRTVDSEIVEFIRNHPLFVRDGRFDDKSYSHILRYSFGLEPRGFEEIVRQNLSIKKLNDLITKDITVNDDEILQAYRKDSEKFKLAYVLIDPKNFVDKVTMDEQVIKDYYEAHKAEFMLPGEDKTTVRAAGFDEVKELIRTYLAEKDARKLALAAADDTYKNISEAMAGGESFEKVVVRLGLKAGTTEFFAKSDYLEGIGEAEKLVDTAVALKPEEASKPIDTRRGILIVKLVDQQAVDEEKFKTQKEEYAKIALERKKNKVLEDWLRGLEAQTSLNITFEDIDKYIR